MKALRMIAICGLLVSAGAGADEANRTARRPVKLRSGPAVFHPMVERLDAGVELAVVEDGARWIKVRTAGGTEGWVSARVFLERPEPRGYGGILRKRGLTGVSSSVATMATRGLTVEPGAGGGVNPLLADFLGRTPFAPEDFERFVQQLQANPICRELPGWMGELDEPLPGDPERDALERRLGLRVAARVLADAELITEPRLDAYVNQVGAAVAAASSRYDLEWRFVVFSQQRPEAFAVPGGFVFLSSGLLESLRDEAELAGVLGHQVAHVALAHGAAALDEAVPAGAADGQPAEQQLQKLVAAALRLLRAPRPARQELAADAYGATYVACAGYDPAGLARVYRRLSDFAARADPGVETAARLRLIERVRAAAASGAVKKLSERFAERVAVLD